MYHAGELGYAPGFNIFSRVGLDTRVEQFPDDARAVFDAVLLANSINPQNINPLMTVRQILKQAADILGGSFEMAGITI
jgi:hypothetical protein